MCFWHREPIKVVGYVTRWDKSNLTPAPSLASSVIAVRPVTTYCKCSVTYQLTPQSCLTSSLLFATGGGCLNSLLFPAAGWTIRKNLRQKGCVTVCCCTLNLCYSAWILLCKENHLTALWWHSGYRYGFKHVQHFDMLLMKFPACFCSTIKCDCLLIYDYIIYF